MTDNGGNDRRRDIEGRINTLGTGPNSASGRGTSREGRSRDSSTDTEADEADVNAGLESDGETETAATDADALAEDVTDGDDESETGADEADEADKADGEAEETDASEDESDDGPAETRVADADERSSLEIELDPFVRAFAARRADQIGEDSLDEYIVGSVKGYLAGLLGGDVESPGTLKRKVEVEADEIFGGLLEAVADEDQDQGDVVVAAVAEAYDVPEDDSLVVAGLRDHEALLNGVVANNSNSLSDVSEVVQAAVETRLIEERAE